MKDEQENKVETIEAKIPKMKSNTSAKITCLGDGMYVFSELDDNNENIALSNYVEQSTYDVERVKHIYDKILDNDNNSYVTTSQELSNLAKNTQKDINKVIKINGIIKYYINKEDLIGRVVEIVENNVNTLYDLNYTYQPKKKKDINLFEEYKTNIIDKFNKQIEIDKLIINNVLKVYTEGNYIFYLKGDVKNGYGIVNYPLDMVEVTNMTIDGENIISFKVNELKSRLSTVLSKYGKLKTNKLINIEKNIDNEIKNNYSKEIYDAYKGKDQLALLDPKKTGLVRINNLGTGLYGVSPIFKSLNPLLTLETIDNSDREILKSRSKKIYYQKSRKELMGKDFDKPLKINEIGYAHTNLLQCMANNTIVYTSMPFIESLEILEPKTDLTDPKIKESYIKSVLTALGIGFISSEGSTSITTVKMVYTELLKMINRITKQLEPIINKFYKEITLENNYPIEFTPTITIQDTETMSLENKMKMVELLYGKLSLSYDTILSMIGLNPESEKNKRIKENEEKVSEIYEPYSTSYTKSAEENKVNTDSNKNDNGSNKNDDINKNEYDKTRQETIK